MDKKQQFASALLTKKINLEFIVFCELASRKLKIYYNSEDINFPEENQLRFRIDYIQNQVKSYKVSDNWETGVIGFFIDLSEIYFVNAKSGLNVRDNNSLDGNKINKLPYGSLVYLAQENQGELTITDTDPITGEKNKLKEIGLDQ